jgi:membrane protease YdiL (CAAX protease family)
MASRFVDWLPKSQVVLCGLVVAVWAITLVLANFLYYTEERQSGYILLAVLIGVPSVFVATYNWWNWLSGQCERRLSKRQRDNLTTYAVGLILAGLVSMILIERLL